MRVVHIAYQYGLNNTGGAAIASSRLHLALLGHGVESHYICIHAREEGPYVHELPRGWMRKLFLLLTRLLRNFWKLTPYRRAICLNIIPLWGLEKELAEIEPDVVHVHWLNADVAAYEQIARLKYHVVLNLHDLDLVLPEEGGYPTDDRYRMGVSRDNTDCIFLWLWNRKGKMINFLNPIFMGPSKWVIRKCAESISGRGCYGLSIPNIIDERFCYDSGLAKAHEKFIVLFGAFGGRGNPLKGWEDLRQALGLIPAGIRSNIEVRIFGEESEDVIDQGVSLKFVGPVANIEKMRDVYHQADVFAFPSVQETQGMTKVEAMLCGLPVVAFNRTACAEGVEHGVTGWVAEDRQGFADGIVHFYTHKADKKFVSDRARNQFDADRIVNAVIRAYREMCGK